MFANRHRLFVLRRTNAGQDSMQERRKLVRSKGAKIVLGNASVRKIFSYPQKTPGRLPHLSGVKRTCLFALHKSAYDPKADVADSESVVKPHWLCGAVW